MANHTISYSIWNLYLCFSKGSHNFGLFGHANFLRLSNWTWNREIARTKCKTIFRRITLYSLYFNIFILMLFFLSDLVRMVMSGWKTVLFYFHYLMFILRYCNSIDVNVYLSLLVKYFIQEIKFLWIVLHLVFQNATILDSYLAVFYVIANYLMSSLLFSTIFMFSACLHQRTQGWPILSQHTKWATSELPFFYALTL